MEPLTLFDVQHSDGDHIVYAWLTQSDIDSWRLEEQGFYLVEIEIETLPEWMHPDFVDPDND